MIYYHIEEWIPPDSAIGGKGFWTVLHKDRKGPWHIEDLREARENFEKLKASERCVRLVEVREVVLECGEILANNHP